MEIPGSITHQFFVFGEEERLASAKKAAEFMFRRLLLEPAREVPPSIPIGRRGLGDTAARQYISRRPVTGAVRAEQADSRN